MSPRSVTIAYLTSSYARATDTFIRDEVRQLRLLGRTVHTFSVRRPDESEVVNDDVARERRGTTYLLDHGPASFARAVLMALIRSPRRFMRAVVVRRELRQPGLKGWLWPWFYLVEACLLAGYLRRRKVQHLHDHIAEGSASVAMLASILTGVPYSLTIHGPSEWDSPGELALDVKARHATFVAVISEHTRGQLCRWISHDDWSKVHVVRCGLRLEEYPEPERHGASDSLPRTLVSVGRVAPVKGHRVLLEALLAARIEAGRLRVVIVGDGPERESLEEFARSAGLAQMVEFTGWQSSERVRAVVAAADGLVMPSFAEGLPVAIMESMASGVPVISSDVGGISELVEPGRSGWLVPAGSVAALAAAIEDLLSTPAPRLADMGAEGRHSVARRHDLVSEVATLDDLIRGGGA
jgi:colanic acid/amylovoran biosynthesis glycosyltransferase